MGLLLIIARRLGNGDAWLTDDLRARLTTDEPAHHWQEVIFPQWKTKAKADLTPAKLRETFLPTDILNTRPAEERARPIGDVEFAQLKERIRADPRMQLVIPHPPIWPVVLASVAFLYLWWLGALIFDLSFVWQRYIRNAVFAHRIREATGGRAEDAQGPEECQNPNRHQEPPAASVPSTVVDAH